MNPWKYTLVFAIPLVTACGLLLGGPALAATPLVVFGFVPLLELVLPGTASNLSSDEEADARQDWRYDAVLYATAPIQLGLIGLFLLKVAAGEFQGLEWLLATVSVGINCGGLGINIGHELGHRSSRQEQRLAKLLLGTSLYAHFFIEHNRGHHSRVATPDDPASSHRDEWLSAFWLRSVLGGWLSAWRLENVRLSRRGLGPWTWQNEMLRLQVFQGAAVLSVAALLGAIPALSFCTAALFGILLLETVNYIEHYGLARNARARGGYERVTPAHSWNSNRTIGRFLLFELTRHSDHHANPKRPYPILRHFEESPQLPTGYPGMVLLALVPPLFFRVMNPRLPQPKAL